MQRTTKSWKTLAGLLAVAPLALAVSTAQAHDKSNDAKHVHGKSDTHGTHTKHIHGKSDTHGKHTRHIHGISDTHRKGSRHIHGKSDTHGMAGKSGMKMSGKKM